MDDDSLCIKVYCGTTDYSYCRYHHEQVRLQQQIETESENNRAENVESDIHWTAQKKYILLKVHHHHVASSVRRLAVMNSQLIWLPHLDGALLRAIPWPFSYFIFPSTSLCTSLSFLLPFLLPFLLIMSSVYNYVFRCGRSTSSLFSSAVFVALVFCSSS